MIPCDEISDTTMCIPKPNCAHRLLGTVCSEKMGGGGDRSIECCALNEVNQTTQGYPLQSSISQKHKGKCMSTD